MLLRCVFWVFWVKNRFLEEKYQPPWFFDHYSGWNLCMLNDALSDVSLNQLGQTTCHPLYYLTIIIIKAHVTRLDMADSHKPFRHGPNTKLGLILFSFFIVFFFNFDFFNNNALFDVFSNRFCVYVLIRLYDFLMFNL
jgi:hypothetical protein